MTFVHNLLFFSCFICLATGAANADIGHHLKPALGQHVAADYESVVLPDGTGLPSGSGSVKLGKTVYSRHCLVCHGADGKQAGNVIVGGQGTLASDKPRLTVGSYWPYATTLFDYIDRAMPYGNEKSLSTDEVYAVTAYVLFMNNIVPQQTILDEETLHRVPMPNRNGFKAAEDYQPLGAPPRH